MVSSFHYLGECGGPNVCDVCAYLEDVVELIDEIEDAAEGIEENYRLKTHEGTEWVCENCSGPPNCSCVGRDRRALAETLRDFIKKIRTR